MNEQQSEDKFDKWILHMNGIKIDPDLEKRGIGLNTQRKIMSREQKCSK